MVGVIVYSLCVVGCWGEGKGVLDRRALLTFVHRRVRFFSGLRLGQNARVARSYCRPLLLQFY